MNNGKYISLLFSVCLACVGMAQQAGNPVNLRVDFLGDTLNLSNKDLDCIRYKGPLSETAVNKFYHDLNAGGYSHLTNELKEYRDKNRLDDWLYYQLIRRTAEQLSPKAENYSSYTLYKWFLLCKSGYDAIIRFSDQKILLYVRSDEIIYNIPNRIRDEKQYVCLNYHDYGNHVDFRKEIFKDADVDIPEAVSAFTYKVTRLPDFNSSAYIEKDLAFNYYHHEYHFRVRLNPDVKSLFTNYPVAEYSSQFNIPLSRETYNSLIPPLKDIVKRMNVVNGVDYLMRFTRYSFLFKKDSEAFGTEKRLSPEETLLYEGSDCEDRAALFFYLVKEIYNLPMIVLAYPQHVTVAVQFDKPVGKPIVYNGVPYYVCDPTPQKVDLQVGEILPSLRKENFEVTYAYMPGLK